nr:MAG TPA: hypothetical protein [Caudoviricetes sp.]
MFYYHNYFSFLLNFYFFYSTLPFYSIIPFKISIFE